MTVKKILVPTDGSNSSKKAFEFAVDLAKGLKAELVVLNVTHTPESFWGYGVPFGIAISQEEIDKVGVSIIEKTTEAADTQGVKLKKVVESGSPSHEILDYIIKNQIDMVVMGSNGHTPIGRLLGSVSQRVLQTSGCPILIVKDEEINESINPSIIA